MFILKKGHQPGVYVPLRALFLVIIKYHQIRTLFLLLKINQSEAGQIFTTVDRCQSGDVSDAN